ncbi:hypothetical protein O6H91_Y327200 [Diphasiastrum complanatum]|nr:hypothetical protein O6H91_Y327200 [Diphasiastrum complanatum]
MGPHANSRMVAYTTWAIGFIIMAINMYFLISTFLKWLLGGHVNKVASVFLGIIVFSCMLLYLGSIGYLAVRTDKEITYLLPPEAFKRKCGNLLYIKLARHHCRCCILTSHLSSLMSDLTEVLNFTYNVITV